MRKSAGRGWKRVGRGGREKKQVLERVKRERKGGGVAVLSSESSRYPEMPKMGKCKRGYERRKDGAVPGCCCAGARCWGEDAI